MTDSAKNKVVTVRLTEEQYRKISSRMKLNGHKFQWLLENFLMAYEQGDVNALRGSSTESHEPHQLGTSLEPGKLIKKLQYIQRSMAELMKELAKMAEPAQLERPNIDGNPVQHAGDASGSQGVEEGFSSKMAELGRRTKEHLADANRSLGRGSKDDPGVPRKRALKK